MLGLTDSLTKKKQAKIIQMYFQKDIFYQQIKKHV